MRSRWSAFGAGLIIYLWWYSVLYVVASHAFAGLPVGLVYGLAAAVVGLIAGGGIGVVARAIELVVEHREVRAGDARDGARVTFGKLPPIVPVVRKTEDTSDHTPSEPTPKPASESLPPTDPDPAPEQGNSDVADTAGIALSEPPADAPGVPVFDRLAAECARFVAEHDTVAVAHGEGGGMGVGTIDRAANLAAFNEFMSVVTALAADGVDVSRVAVSMGTDGVPAAVTFPVSSNDEGVFQ